MVTKGQSRPHPTIAKGRDVKLACFNLLQHAAHVLKIVIFGEIIQRRGNAVFGLTLGASRHILRNVLGCGADVCL
jgi:hypothetical protein